jgi:hypothetical protein
MSFVYFNRQSSIRWKGNAGRLDKMAITMIYNSQFTFCINQILTKNTPNDSPKFFNQTASNLIISIEMIKYIIWLLFRSLYGIMFILVSEVAQLVLRLVTG